MTALVFLAVFGVYLHGASPAVAARDAADMAATAFNMGVAHPPGYPLYSLLGHLWLAVLSAGNPAYRLAVLSALAGAGACAFVFSAVCRRAGAWSGFGAAAALAFSAPLLKFYLIQEKYSLHALFAAALIWLAEGDEASETRRARLSGLVAGLGLVNHQSLLFFLPALPLLWGSRRRALLAGVPWLALGLTPYAFLWVRLGSLSEAISVALRSRYGAGTLSAQLAQTFSPAGAAVLLGWSLKSWVLAAGVPAAVLALYMARETRARGLLLGALLSGPLFVLLSRFDPANWVARSVLEPAFLVPALVTALLAGEAAARLGRWTPAAALFLAVSPFVPGAPVPERRDDFLAHDYARNLRRAVPPGGSVLVAGDTALFGLRWLELTSARSAPIEIAGAGLVEPRAWLAARAGRAGVFVAGLAPGVLPSDGLTPAGLVQRLGKIGPAAPVILRRSSSWRRDESYARDAKLAYAFAAWSSARLLEARGGQAPETLDLTAAALDPEDYRLE